MGTTPNLGLPYPEDPDTPNVPRDIKALATKLDGLLGRAGSKDHPIRVIDSGYTDAWAPFRTTAGTTSGYTVFPKMEYKGNNIRWQFEAPEDGVLQLHGNFTLGYLKSHTTTMALNFIMQYHMLDGTSAGAHTGNMYSRVVRHSSGDSGQTDGLDLTYFHERWAFLPKGAKCSPAFSFSGTTRRNNEPKYIFASIKGLWIPGQMVRDDIATTGGAVSAFTGTAPAGPDLPDPMGFDLPAATGPGIDEV